MISPSKNIISSFLTIIGIKLVSICIIKFEFFTPLKIVKPLITFEYIFNNKSFFIASGTIPNPRAAHAACCPSENQLIIYGGATGCKSYFIN
jgi:hypothetical protein